MFGLFKRPDPVKERKASKRSYAAADKIARYGDFRSSRGSADYELRGGLAEIRAKSRFLARNSGSMKRYIQLMRVNIVGEGGFRYQCRVKMNDGKLNISLNERVEQAWADWCDAPTVCGQMSMNVLLHQAISTWCRDGEVIWELVEAGRFKDGLAINPIESDQLDETLNTIHPSTQNEIRMGVEVNSDGRPVAYHFLTTHPGDLTWTIPNSSRQLYRRVPASSVIHVYERLRPGQTRGEPPASAMLLGIKMLDGYREAETVGRRLRAAISGFFTRTMPGVEQIDGLADREDEQEELFEMDIEPGRLKQLPDGVEFKEFSPGGSQTDYADYEQQIKKDISMGIGISTMSHGMEVSGISYSSGRTVAIEDRDYYKTMQSFFIGCLMPRTFTLWTRNHMIFAEELAFLPSQLDRVRKTSVFRARGWDWVDPAKEVKATREALAANLTSLSRVAAARGMDRDELLDEIAEDQQAAADRGLTLTYSDGKGSQTEIADVQQPDNS